MNQQKQRIFDRIDDNRAAILDRSRLLFDTPELGYREFETGRLIRGWLDGWGVPYESVSYTGLMVTLGQGAPVVAVLADMDGLPKKAGEGRIHSCGHSLQTSAALALIEAMKDEPLSGTLKVIFTPAEEMIDFDYRQSLVDRGLVKYPSGKQDMIARGVFDDVDAVLSCHASGEPGCRFDVGSTLKGFVIFKAVYQGLGAHAGAAPYAGKNALHAAVLAQTGVAFLKDRFDPRDGVNVQPVISEAAGTVNIVPDRAVVETYVRARTEEALFAAADLVENCLKRCGQALDIETEVARRPGFLPLSQSGEINALVKANMLLLCGEDQIREDLLSGASGDVGDIGALLPTLPAQDPGGHGPGPVRASRLRLPGLRRTQGPLPENLAGGIKSLRTKPPDVRRLLLWVRSNQPTTFFSTAMWTWVRKSRCSVRIAVLAMG